VGQKLGVLKMKQIQIIDSVSDFLEMIDKNIKERKDAEPCSYRQNGFTESYFG
jgi:hypothetical protein